MTTTAARPTAETVTVQALEARIVALEAQLAESERKRQACRTAYIDLSKQLRTVTEERDTYQAHWRRTTRRDLHRRALMRNPEPSASVKLAGLALIDVFDLPVLDAPALPGGATGAEPELQQCWRKQIAERTGTSEQCAGDALDSLVKLGAARKQTQTTRAHRGGKLRSDLLLAPTRALLLAPEKLAYPPEEKPNRGGKRPIPILCPECESTDLQEVRTILRKRTCRSCGHTWEPDPEVGKPHALNRDDPDTADDGADPDLEIAPELPPERPEGDAYPHWWATPGAPCDWYDPSQPDEALSQALTYYLGRGPQADLWYSSLALAERFMRNQTITRTRSGPLDPETFLAELRGWYDAGEHGTLRTIAKVLGVDPKRIGRLHPDPDPDEDGSGNEATP